MQAERVGASAQLRVQLLELLTLVRPQHFTSSCPTSGTWTAARWTSWRETPL